MHRQHPPASTYLPLTLSAYRPPPCSNSPGGVNFESAPFKLTRELLEVMDSSSEGKTSELFDYFKVGGWLAGRLAGLAGCQGGAVRVDV